MALRNLVAGLVAAAAVAFIAAVPTIGGISTWKYLAGAIGMALFVRAGMSRPRADH